MEPAAPRHLETPVEAARRLALDRVITNERQLHRAVLMMVRRGELRGVRVGKWTMVDPSSVDAFIAGGKK